MLNSPKSVKISRLVDGMRTLLKRTLIAHTPLNRDANKGDMSLRVDNAARFRAGEQIVIFNDLSEWDNSTGVRRGVEFHNVVCDAKKTDIIELQEPLGMDFLLSDNSRIQKAIGYAILNEKDVYYGDRENLTFQEVAICVEPETKSSEWLALGGLGSYESRLAIMVYVSTAGTGGIDEDRAARVCNDYADAIEDLLIRNIHLDIATDEIALVADACPGDTSVFIPKGAAWNWQPDPCGGYQVLDNFNMEQFLYIKNPGGDSSSESSSSCRSFDISTSSRSLISSSSNSSGTEKSASSSSSQSSFDDSSSSSPSTISKSVSSSSSSSNVTDDSSVSQGGAYEVQLGLAINKPSWAITKHIRVADKAVLRRHQRWIYDSRVDNAEYGVVAKGSYILKSAKLSWFGKETRQLTFPQIGIGGEIY